MPRITDFCSCVCVFGCKLGLVRLCESNFGITPVDDITIGITCAAFLLPHSTYFIRQFLVLVLFVGIVLARLCEYGRAMPIKKLFFVFLFIKIMSGRLKGIILSVSMLRFQYGLKFSFSNTLAAVYL